MKLKKLIKLIFIFHSGFFQQQHSFKLQLGHSLEDAFILHSFGMQLQSENTA